METSGRMEKKKSTCLYLDREVVGTARRTGLNLSKICENALVEAVGCLNGPKREDGLGGRDYLEGRDRDSDPGAGLHRPVG